jgi:hypothetical protein
MEASESPDYPTQPTRGDDCYSCHVTDCETLARPRSKEENQNWKTNFNRSFLAYFPYFEKKKLKQAYALSMLSVYHPY